MNRIHNLELWAGRLPIGRTIEALLVLVLLAALAALGGCASATPQPVKVTATAAAPDPQVARAQALQKIGESAAPTDGETRRMAIMAVMAMNGQAGSQAPQQLVPQAPTIGGIVLGVVDRLLGISPAWFAYKSSIRNSQTTETVAAINRDVSIAQSNNFTQLGIAGVNGTAAVGISGMNSLATVASHPTTSIAITGNQGPVNNGTGTQTNSSNNPVNPAPKVCGVTTVAGVICTP